jgi:CXXX repeat peptide maturase
MLHYLLILLDDTSVSYCHYENPKTERKLISPEDLKAGIMFAMKQNLMIQFVYPDYELPEAYKIQIASIDHNTIAPVGSCTHGVDVAVFNNWREVHQTDFAQLKDRVFVLRTNRNELFSNYEQFIPCLSQLSRLNIVITDMENFTEEDFKTYQTVLSHLKTALKERYLHGSYPQVNILTDRIVLDTMNNCNAGIENITLASNGKFYICPAFYLEDADDSVGDLACGLAVKNKQLYHIDHAPLCRICDAYQCKRCVWLNRKTTLEVNTPSHEQCVVAHVERNTSKELLNELSSAGSMFSDKEIKRIDYVDPFEIKAGY